MPLLFEGQFSGQLGYGYRSFEAFIDAVTALKSNKINIEQCDRTLPTIGTTLQETAVLEAGRLSLDNQSAIVEIIYETESSIVPFELKVKTITE